MIMTHDQPIDRDVGLLAGPLEVENGGKGSESHSLMQSEARVV